MSNYFLVFLSFLSTATCANTSYSDAAIYTGGKPNFRITDTEVRPPLMVNSSANGTGYGTVGRPSSKIPSIASPGPIMGIPYADGLKDGNKINPPNYNTTVDPADLSVVDKPNGEACSARGFVCDFSVVNMKSYGPLDFVWKVVDPLDYGKPGYEQKTLNCEVQITAPDNATRAGENYFYVPLGQEHIGSNDYCDIEAIRRVVNEQGQNMTDRIRIRGETARLHNNLSTLYDLIGEQFDLTCACVTILNQEASIEVVNSLKTMRTYMDATGQSREMRIEMLLFNDTLLNNQIKLPMQFPQESPTFFFVIRHLLRNDWDIQLQFNKCVACGADAPYCNTTVANDDAVIFYEECSVLQGGPQLRPVNSSSWYLDPTVDHVWKYAADPTTRSNHRWSDKVPTMCPYHALGFQKFRLAKSAQMQVVCAITGCEKRPCKPCEQKVVITRRSLFDMHRGMARSVNYRRTLQGAPGDFEPVDLGLTINFEDAPSEDRPTTGGNSGSSDKSGSIGNNLMLLALLLLLAVISALVVYHTRKTHAKKQKNKSVQPSVQSTEDHASLQGY